MRIAIATVQAPFVLGGAELHAIELKKAFVAEGHDAEIVTFPFNHAVPESIPGQMLACRLLNMNKVHGMTVDRMIALKFPAYLIPHPNKVVWLLHQHRAAYDLWGNPFENLDSVPRGLVIRQAIRLADRELANARSLFANSQNVARRLRQYCEIESTPLYHPPPHAECFYCAPKPLEYILFLSRLSAIKRQTLVLKALAHTKQPVRVRFGGVADSRAYADRLKFLAEELGVQARVEWMGDLTETQKYKAYAEAVAVVFPPVDEDYGYITLEAMLSSKAVITCTDSGGALEFVQHEETGLVTEPTAEALAVALDKLWRERKLAAEYGRQGRSRYDRLGLSWSHVVASLLA
jgi:glycosyltransferase involved in cell wall biosynthesis